MNDELSKVTKIVDPAFKRGVGKNGKPWLIQKVEGENGHVANSFDNLEVGELAVFSYDEKFKWSAKRATPEQLDMPIGKPSAGNIAKAPVLDEINTKLDILTGKIDALAKLCTPDEEEPNFMDDDPELEQLYPEDPV